MSVIGGRVSRERLARHIVRLIEKPQPSGITVPVCHLPEVVLEQTLSDKVKPDMKAMQANSITRQKQEYYTLAEALHDAGYVTGHFGKWHLGHKPQFRPLRCGYQEYLGILYSTACTRWSCGRRTG